MEYPFGRAVWDYLAYHEQKNNLQICNATERELLAAHQQLAQEERAKQETPAPRSFLRTVSEEKDYAI